MVFILIICLVIIISFAYIIVHQKNKIKSLYEDTHNVYIENSRSNNIFNEINTNTESFEYDRLKKNYDTLKEAYDNLCLELRDIAIEKHLKTISQEHSLIHKVGKDVYWKSLQLSGSPLPLKSVMFYKNNTAAYIEKLGTIRPHEFFGDDKQYTFDKEEWIKWKEEELNKLKEK